MTLCQLYISDVNQICNCLPGVEEILLGGKENNISLVPQGLLPRQYLLNKAKFIDQHLRHFKRGMPIETTIFL